jgi:hypothetical protein
MDAFFSALLDGLAKAWTFVTSRRNWFVGAVTAVLLFVAFFSPEAQAQNAAIIAALGKSIDSGAAALLAISAFAKDTSVLVGLIVIYVMALKSHINFPAQLTDYKTGPRVEVVALPKL